MPQILSSKTLVQGAQSFSSIVLTAEADIRNKWDFVIDAINMQRRQKEVVQNNAQAISDLRDATHWSLNALRKEELLSLLISVGHRQSAGLRKQQLVEKIFHLRASVENGSIQLQEQAPEPSFSTAFLNIETENPKMNYRNRRLQLGS